MSRCIGMSMAILIVVFPQIGLATDTPAERDRHSVMVRKAINYLVTKGRESDGSYSRGSGPALTALVTTALLRHGIKPSDPRVADSLTYLQGFQREDGGIYQPGTFYKNYETSVAVACFAAANGDNRYDKLLSAANRFLRGLQWDESEELNRSDPGYGGAGYGKHGRPDLSNTSFLIDALVAADDGQNSEALQRALMFVSRCQNLESEHNNTPFATRSPDGGFYYTPAAGGQSQAGLTPNGGLRSYGSMTYAGLKSMIYAGVGPEDPRVKAATEWIQANYQLEMNPGMGTSGLYYYYHTFAKALAAMKLDHVRDASGEKHNWRAELIVELASRQRTDGSWANEDPRWMENDPNLVTAYALLALSYCGYPRL